MITLGINYNKTHDSAACIVRDGEVVFAVAEERLSRTKHDASFPQMAIQACLDFAKVRSDQLDEVCFGWTRAGAGFRHDLKCLATGGLPLTYLNVVTTTMYFLSMWHQESGAKRFRGNGDVKWKFFRGNGGWRLPGCATVQRSGEDDRICCVIVPSDVDLSVGTDEWRGTYRAPGTLGIIGANGVESGTLVGGRSHANAPAGRTTTGCVPCDVDVVLVWTVWIRVHCHHGLVIEVIRATGKGEERDGWVRLPAVGRASHSHFSAIDAIAIAKKYNDIAVEGVAESVKGESWVRAEINAVGTDGRRKR